MNRLEKKYLLKEQIKQWSNGKYSDDVLSNINITELEDLYNQLYCKELSKIY